MMKQPHEMPQPCRQWAKRLAATYLEDLAPIERRALQAHIAACPACAAALAEYHVMDAGIHALPAVEPLPASAIAPTIDMPVPQTTRSEGYEPVRAGRRLPGAASRPHLAMFARVGAAAAVVLLVGAIVSSFLLLAATHRPHEGNTGAHAPSSAASTPGITKQSLLCPADGTARAAMMHPVALGHDPALVYVDNEQSAPSPKAVVSLLKRYNVMTHQTADILKLPGVLITGAEVSPDGQWVLFAAQESNIYQVRIVRVDGKDMQTLVCSASEYMRVSWSPDQQWALMTQMAAQASVSKEQLELLNLASGKLQTLEMSGADNLSYSYNSVWLNSTQFIVPALETNTNGQFKTLLYSITVSPGQPMSNPRQLTSPFPGTVDLTSDGNGQLYIAECDGGPKAAIPPCGISVLLSSGGQPRAIYKTSTLAINAIGFYNHNGLLLMVYNVTGNTNQNGVWKINSSGTGLTRLLPTAASNPTIFNLFALDPWANVSRDGQWYAQKIVTLTRDTLVIGSMSGGPLTTINTRSQNGWSGSGAVGWTTS